MNILSLFANVGIAELQLDNKFNTVVANEISSKRVELYKQIFPNVDVIQGDILDDKVYKEILDSSIKNNVEIIMATPPCQGMSTAGKMKSNDKRNSLIIPAINMIKDINPKYVFLENIPNQIKTIINVNNQEISILDYIKQELSEFYHINYSVEDAADYGVPQHRKRSIFLLTNKKIKSTPWDFPNEKTEHVTLREAIGHLDEFESLILDEEYIEKVDVDYNHLNEIQNRNYWHRPKKIAWRYIEAMMHTPTGQSAFENEVYYPRKLDGNKMKGFKNTFKRMSWDKPSPTVTMQSGNIGSQENGHPGNLKPDGTYSNARVLSIHEIMIIMSIPTNWNIPRNTSDNFIREVIGEGIPPLMVSKIFNQIKGEDNE